MVSLAAVQAGLDRYRITEGETVTLTIRTDSPRQSLDADFSRLERDFDILDRRSETQLSIVNGEQTAVVRLLLTLEPRRVGDLEIPPLVFGQDQTARLPIRVDPAPQPEPGTPPPVFIEMEVSPGEGPYFVHAQLGLIVRVFYQQNLTEAAISPPDPSPASVRLLQETPYQAERGGARYRVLERIYAVFPERSGDLNLPPMKLTGRLVERKAGSIWQPTVRGRRVQVESKAMVLPIEPKPPLFTGAEWQPARDYQLTQQVSSGDSLRVGEPITRTVIVDAVGLEENMIVEPTWPEVADVRIYPDQPQGITRDDGRWVLGHKEFRYAVVPEKEGELVLPELRVEWWDTRSNRQQTAKLEAHTVYVRPPKRVPAADREPAEARAGPSAPQTAAAPDSRDETRYWRFLASLFALLWIVTLLAAWRLRGSRPGATGPARAESALPAEEAGLLGELKRACERGNTQRARRALQTWLRRFGPEGVGASLMEFADQLDDQPLCESVQDLDSEGFRPDREGDWDGTLFWKRFKNWQRQRLDAVENSRPDPTNLYARENRQLD
jgi:hypothetical protein